jgi:hypothetical protein
MSATGLPPADGVPPDLAEPDGTRPGPGPADGVRPRPRPAEPVEEAPGLFGQVGATRDSVKRLVGAHVELAKAEFADISDRIKGVAILAGIAAAVGFGAGLLLLVGLPLFLGELIFGSIGWGLLLGLLFFAGIAVAAGVGIANEGLGVDKDALERAEQMRWAMDPDAADRAQHDTDAALQARPRVAGRVIAGGLIGGIVIGLVVGIVLGLDLTNRAWSAVGDAILPGVDAGARPLAAAALVLAVIGGLLGLIGGFRAGGGAGAVGGLVAGAVGGVALGALTALAPGPRVGAAIGVATALIAWVVLMATGASRAGFSGHAFTLSMKPQRTIDTAKETIEWARERMPLSRRS